MIDFRRSHQEKSLDQGTRAAKGFFKSEKLRCVRFRELFDALRGAAHFRIEKQRAAIVRERTVTATGFEPFEAVTLELHVLYDCRNEGAMHSFKNRSTEAGMEFFSDCRAPDSRASFEDERLVARACEIEGGDQRVLSGSDDDDALSQSQFARRSLRISSAASRPGAPMIPPPGCVAEPHI